MIRILIADDHQLLRDTWSLILNMDKRFTIVGSCSNSTETVKMSRALKPDILLLDINMSPFNGIEATQKIRKISPETGIIAVTMSNLLAHVKAMLQLGALGYVTKNSSIDEMVEAILTVSKGDVFICSEMRELLSDSRAITENFSAVHLLTNREVEIVNLIRTGRSSKEICTELNISLNTVETHRYNISRKLKVKNAVSLIQYMNHHAAHAEFSE